MNGRRYPCGRPAEGTTIHVPAYGSCEVLAHTDPGLVRLRMANGKEVRVGERALREMLTEDGSGDP